MKTMWRSGMDDGQKRTADLSAVWHMFMNRSAEVYRIEL